MKKIAFIFVLCLFVLSCQNSKKPSKIVVADWLVGKWENKSVDGDLLENWSKVNDSIFEGESYFIKGEDTLHSEKIQLVQKGESLLYISTIKGQNSDKPTTLKHNATIEKQLVFENPKMDYPKKISYSPTSKKALIIEISGTQDGKPSSDNYSMKKTE